MTHRSQLDIDASIVHGFERRFQSSLVGRKIISTKRGYIGLATEAVAAGDVVCILLGGRMPVILRPNGGNYQFLCEAYVHGLMFGEVLKVAELEGITAEELKLV
jgi:hypothetical protein